MSENTDVQIEQLIQFHVHEVIGSTLYAEEGEDRHNHRFALVSSQAIILPDGHHVHLVSGDTDFYEDHFHPFSGQSSIEIIVGEGKHVHFALAETFEVDNHAHLFQFAALINSPLTQEVPV